MLTLTRLLILLILIAAACTPNTPAATTPTAPPGLKTLATLYVSPTPNVEQREATRLAARSAPPTPLPTRTPEPTAYVGVFLGEAEMGEAPVIDPARYAGTLQAGNPPATFGVVSCRYPIDSVFGGSWTANTDAVDALGCPTAPPAPFSGTMQTFERGVMFFLPTSEIFAINVSANGGQWWYIPQAPPDQSWDVNPPSGLFVPSQGFGAVWKADEDIRLAMGYATAGETGASLTIQPFDNGRLLRESGLAQTFVLVNDTRAAYGGFE